MTNIRFAMGLYLCIVILKPSQNMIDDNYYDFNDYGSDYGEYAGSYAQDVEGYSDDDINDAFDGDPEAYWNID